jgi:hypothetical protein
MLTVAIVNLLRVYSEGVSVAKGSLVRYGLSIYI